MSDPATDFSGIVRLFPLPNVVLFPHALQPLQIFEPRYLALLQEALSTDRLITMVLLRSGWEEHAQPYSGVVAGNPPIHSVGCVGEIVAEQPAEDNRQLILLRGAQRVRLKEFESDAPFRRAHAEAMTEPVPSANDLDYCRQQLLDCFQGLCADLVPQDDPIQRWVNSEVSLAMLTDVLAYSLDLDMAHKQRLLEEPDVLKRAAQLETILRSANGFVRPLTHGRPFPPDFSTN